MATFEKEVISIPAADSHNLILTHSIHAHPDTEGYPYKKESATAPKRDAQRSGREGARR